MTGTFKKLAILFLATLLVACGGGGGGGFVITPTAVFTNEAEAKQITIELLESVYAPQSLGTDLSLEFEDFVLDPDLLLLCTSGTPGTVQASLIPPNTLELVFDDCIDFVQEAGGSVSGTLNGTIQITQLSNTSEDSNHQFSFTNFSWNNDNDNIEDVNGQFDFRMQTPLAGPNTGDTLVNLAARDFDVTVEGEPFSYLRLTWSSHYMDESETAADDFYGWHDGFDFLEAPALPGIVGFSTPVELIYDYANEWFKQGIIFIDGEGGSYIRIEIIDTSCLAEVAIDTDGDGEAPVIETDWNVNNIGLSANGCLAPP